jgi:hypothetical protein
MGFMFQLLQMQMRPCLQCVALQEAPASTPVQRPSTAYVVCDMLPTQVLCWLTRCGEVLCLEVMIHLLHMSRCLQCVALQETSCKHSCTTAFYGVCCV